MPFNEVHFHIGESLRDSQIAEILLRSPSRRDGATCFIERYWALPGLTEFKDTTICQESPSDSTRSRCQPPKHNHASDRQQTQQQI